MPQVAKPTGLNTLAWVAGWPNKPKVPRSVDGVLLIQHQVFKVSNPADLVSRGGCDFIAKPDINVVEANKVPLTSEAAWLIGNDIYAILLAFQSQIGWSLGQVLNYEHGRKLANYIALYGAIGTEFIGEGKLRDLNPPAVTTGDHVTDFEQGIAFRLKERYAQEGRKMYYKTTYGGFHTFWHKVKFGWRVDGVHYSPTDSRFRNLLVDRNLARQSCAFLQLGYDTNFGMVHDVKLYAEDFISATIFYRVLFALRVCAFAQTQPDGTIAGGVCLHFWSKVEQLPGKPWALHNGFRYVRDVLNGKVITTEHPQFSHNLLEAICFFAFATKASVWNWENSEIFGTDPAYMSEPNPEPTQDRANYVAFIPNAGSGASAPYVAGKNYPESPMGYMDIPVRAKEYYNSTVKTEGVDFQDLRYKRVAKLTSGGWIDVNEPYTVAYGNGSTVLDWAAANDGPNGDEPGQTPGGLCVIGRQKVVANQEHNSFALYHPVLDGMEKYMLKMPNGREFGPYIVKGDELMVFNETV